jgi:hypothetical protein
MAQVPRIVKSPLSNHWYVVTRYRERDGIDLYTGAKTRYLVAQVKHDVTDQMTAILNAHKSPARKRKAS